MIRDRNQPRQKGTFAQTGFRSRNRKRRVLDFLRSRFAVVGIITVLIGALLLHSLAKLQLTDAQKVMGQETKGVSRQMKVEAPRGDILDVNGVPLAYNKYVNNIYIAYAGLKDSELNAVLLDLAELFDEFEVTYGEAVDQYLDLETMTFAMEKDKMIEWQKNTNYLGLKALPEGETESSKDTQFVKETPRVFFDFMSQTKFKIPQDIPLEDQFKIFRFRFQLYLNNWFFIQGEPIPVATDVPAELAAIVSEQNYRYIGVLDGESPQRNYAENAADIAQVLGYVGSISAEEIDEYTSRGYSNQEKVGKAGIESIAEQYLHGTSGVKPYNIWTPDEASQSQVTESGGKTPFSGYDVQLTVRMDVQKVAMDALKEYVDSVAATEDDVDSAGAAGTAVMINLKDGGSIVAMASYPSYDPQDFIDMTIDEEAAARVQTYLQDTNLKPMMNRAISQVYAPGSTFKAFIGVAAADEEVINASTIYNCQRYMDVDGQEFRCTGRHGEIALNDALAYSCNIYFYHAGMTTGIDKLTAALKEFKLGEKTGIELSGEASGLRPSREMKASLYADPGDQQWFPADTAQISIGQGLNSYTVLQLARATGGIATGYLTNPHIIRQVTAQDGSIVFKSEAEDIPLSFSEYGLDIVRQGMREVVTNPGSTSYSEFGESPVAVAGKTGTAETNYGDGQIQTNGLFICFAPYDDPEIAVAVAAESGARGAGVSSVASEMIKAYYGVY